MKRFLKIFAILMLMFPIMINAEEYTSQTLKEACESEEIDFTSTTYKESDDKVNVYLFRGSGCSHCHEFLTYMESIVDEYGKYFNIVSYETLNDEANANLMTTISDYFGDNATGVPYIVIGDKTWIGFAESAEEEILTKIKSEYDSSERFDVMAQIGKNTNKTSNSSSDGDGLTVFILVVLVVLDGFIIYKTTKDKKYLEEKIDKLERKIKSKK